MYIYISFFSIDSYCRQNKNIYSQAKCIRNVLAHPSILSKKMNNKEPIFFKPDKRSSTGKLCFFTDQFSNQLWENQTLTTHCATRRLRQGEDKTSSSSYILYILHSTFYILHSIFYHLPPTTYHVPPTTYHLSPTTFHQPPTTCHLTTEIIHYL